MYRPLLVVASLKTSGLYIPLVGAIESLQHTIFRPLPAVN